MSDFTYTPFNGTEPEYVSAGDYLKAYPNRGKTLRIKPFKNPFHIVYNCLSSIIPSTISPYCGQILSPVNLNSDKRIYFTESHRASKALDMELNCIHSYAHCNNAYKFDVAVSIAPLYSENFWHWTYECAPKIIALEKNKYTGPYLFAESNHLGMEFCRMLGISPERIIRINGTCFVKKLLVLPNSSHSDDIDVVEMLVSEIKNAVGILQDEKRLYVKRILRRVIINEEEVVNYLEKFGFQTMTPEDHSIRDQFRNMTNSVITLTAHGANSTLILAKPDSSHFIECFSQGHVGLCNLGAIQAKNITYSTVVDVSTPPPEEEKINPYLKCYRNMRVDMRLLRVIVEQAVLLSEKIHHCGALARTG